jgi:hypothetical protein
VREVPAAENVDVAATSDQLCSRHEQPTLVGQVAVELVPLRRCFCRHSEVESAGIEKKNFLFVKPNQALRKVVPGRPCCGMDVKMKYDCEKWEARANLGLKSG